MTKVSSVLSICKLWRKKKGPPMHNCGPHPFCVLLENRKLGEGRRKREKEEEGRKKMGGGKGRGPTSPRRPFLSLFCFNGHIHAEAVQPSCLSCSWALNTATPKPGMANPSPGPDLRVSLLHPGREVCV